MVEPVTTADDLPPRTEREPRLDLLRALIVVGLVFFHSALIFDPHDDYYVKSTVTTEAVTVLAGLAVVWAMPLLFLIAGMGVLHSLRRRSFGGFVRERVRRLLVPLVFGSVTLNALPVWFRTATDSQWRRGRRTWVTVMTVTPARNPSRPPPERLTTTLFEAHQSKELYDTCTAIANGDEPRGTHLACRCGGSTLQLSDRAVRRSCNCWKEPTYRGGRWDDTCSQAQADSGYLPPRYTLSVVEGASRAHSGM
jgi:hypothetical protein